MPEIIESFVPGIRRALQRLANPFSVSAFHKVREVQKNICQTMPQLAQKAPLHGDLRYLEETVRGLPLVIDGQDSRRDFCADGIRHLFEIRFETLTPAQTARAARIENSIKHHAKHQDFEGVSKELKGEKIIG